MVGWPADDLAAEYREQDYGSPHPTFGGEVAGSPAAAAATNPAPAANRPVVVALVASAGGVEALSTVVAALPGGLRAAVVIAQHLSPTGPSALAAILDARSELPVRTAEDGDRLEPGTVLVTPAGRHLLVTAGHTVVLVDTDEPPPSRPSADLLLVTLAAVAGARVVAVVLTGYGHDGQSGVRAVHRCGGYVLAQDRASSQQFAMPAAAIATGVVDEIVALDRLADAISRAVAALDRGP